MQYYLIERAGLELDRCTRKLNPVLRPRAFLAAPLITWHRTLAITCQVRKAVELDPLSMILWQTQQEPLLARRYD